MILASLAWGCESDTDRRNGHSLGTNTNAKRRLYTVVARRLALMPAVARWKWERRLPIEDHARELEVIHGFVQQAHQRGLDQQEAQTIIVAQLEAAKMVQQECFDRWNRSPPPRDSQLLDLGGDLRPHIDRLNRELLDVVSSKSTLELTDIATLPPATQRALAPWGKRTP